MARKKTVLGGLNIGPDVELLILVAGGAALVYWLWEKYGSTAVTAIGTDISNAAGDVTGAFSSGGGDTSTEG